MQLRWSTSPTTIVSLKRNGSYERAEPPGARVARWYCPLAHTTFSLLPDCLAARLPGSLAELEQVVAAVEQAPSLEGVADRLRPDIQWPGRLRWVRRRLSQVHAALAALITMCPVLVGNCEPTLGSVRARLGERDPGASLRELSEAWLTVLPPPLGFGPRLPRGCSGRQQQHDLGPRGPPRAQ